MTAERIIKRCWQHCIFILYLFFARIFSLRSVNFEKNVSTQKTQPCYGTWFQKAHGNGQRPQSSGKAPRTRQSAFKCLNGRLTEAAFLLISKKTKSRCSTRTLSSSVCTGTARASCVLRQSFMWCRRSFTACAPALPQAKSLAAQLCATVRAGS